MFQLYWFYQDNQTTNSANYNFDEMLYSKSEEERKKRENFRVPMIHFQCKIIHAEMTYSCLYGLIIFLFMMSFTKFVDCSHMTEEDRNK